MRIAARPRPLFARQSGFVLILALALVVLAAGVVVALLASLGGERASSVAIANATRAELAAQAASEVCIANLRHLFETFPDSATTWESVGTTGATVLYFRESPNGVPDATVPLRRFPLISGAAAGPIDEPPGLTLANASLDVADPENSIDLNRARYSGDSQGWIGSPPGGKRREIRVPWVEMKSPGSAGKVIARYAFWAEDESFKLNLNRLAQTATAEGIATSPDEIPWSGFLDLFAPTLLAGARELAAAQLSAIRNSFPGRYFPEIGLLNKVVAAPGLGDNARYYGTLYSACANVSRGGTKRVNLNRLAGPSTDPTEIRAQLDAILAPIEREIPDFGKRFYAGSPEKPVTSPHAGIYLQKIAANLRDYLTPGSQPTIVLQGGEVLLAGKPVSGIEPPPGGSGENPVLAIGKKNLPYLQEYALRITLKKFDPVKKTAGNSSSSFEFYFDHYFEFWNMTDKDIRVADGDLGPNPFLKVYNLPGFQTTGTAGVSGTPLPAGRSFEIPLPSTLVFEAGKTTVLTTDPEPPAELIQALERVVILPRAAAQFYEGTTTLTASASGGTYFRVNLAPRSSASTDYETKMLLGNDYGLLDSFCALPIVRGSSSGNLALQIHNDSEGKEDDTITGSRREYYFLRGGSLRGNRIEAADAPLAGDPRTLNEQLVLRTYDAAGDNEQTRFYNSGLDNPSTSTGALHVPAESTLGLPNANFVDFTRWPDTFEPDPNHIDTPMVLAGGPMRSIGELGHLFDPVRPLGPANNILYSRGGGRTLSIGQPDPLWDGDPFSESRNRTAWRLADLFTVRDELRMEGLVNPNGALRDDGAAIKAMLEGFRFSSGQGADPGVSGSALPEAMTKALVSRLKARLEKAGTLGPLMERGELSEFLAMPESESSGLSPRYDRGREELFRRMVESVCTRGNVFTVYAVGQSIAQTPSGQKTATATARLRLTFELVPVWDPPLPETDSVPLESDRIRPPSSYKVRILAAGP